MKEFLIEHSIAIVAALFTMITMIFSCLNYFSRNKRSSKLYYYTRKAFRIFSNQSTVFKGLSVQYDGEPISSDIIQIDGKMVCKGKDINSENNQITISAPVGSEWLDISIDQKNNTNATASISKENQKEAVLSFNKFRRNNSFIINAVIKTNKDLSEMDVHSIHETITFEHSIDDTDDVKIYNGDNYYFKYMILLPVLLVFFVGEPLLLILYTEAQAQFSQVFLILFSALLIVSLLYLVFLYLRSNHYKKNNS